VCVCFHRYEHFQEHNKALKLLNLQHNELSNEWCMLLRGLAEVGQGRVVQL